MSRFIFSRPFEWNLSSSPTQMLKRIERDQLAGFWPNIVEGGVIYSPEEIGMNRQCIKSLLSQYVRQLQPNEGESFRIGISLMQVFLAYQARHSGHVQRLYDDQWLSMAFTHLSSVGKKSQWHELALKGVLLIYDYHQNYEEKVMHLIKSIQLIGMRQFFIQNLYYSILKATFIIKISSVFGEYLITQKMARHTECNSLRLFCGKGFTQSQQDALVKLSLLNYALNAVVSQRSSVREMAVVRRALFEHQSARLIIIFEKLMTIARKVFRQRGSCPMTLSFRKMLESFKETCNKFSLIACPVVQTIMESMMIMGGLQIPLPPAERGQTAWGDQLETMQQWILPFISQQYAKSMMDPLGQSVVVSQDYTRHFQQHLFQAEDIIIQYIPFHFQYRLDDQPIRNLQFLFYKLHLLIECPLKLEDKLRMCIYYLALCHKLGKATQKGVTVLRDTLASIPTQPLLPRERPLIKAVISAVGLKPTRPQRAILSNLVVSIDAIDSQASQYIRRQYLEDRKNHGTQLSQQFDCICSFDYYLFGKSLPPLKIRDALSHPDLQALIQKYVGFSGSITPYHNTFIEKGGCKQMGQFLAYRQKIQQFLQEYNLVMESMPMVRGHLDEAFEQERHSYDPQSAVRRLGEKILGLLKCGFLVGYCLIALGDYLSPLNRQRILEIHYQQDSWRIIDEVVNIMGADRETSTALFTF